MSYTETRKLIKEYLKDYSKEEFYELIDFIDNKELNEPIKNNPKHFEDSIRGFRAGKLDKRKLKDIYYRYIFKKEDPILGAKLSTIINKNAIKILELLEFKLDYIDETDEITLNLENNKEDIDQIVDTLLGTCYCKNILLAFKFIGVDLDEPTKRYINEKTEYYMAVKDASNKIVNNIKLEFNDKLKEKEKELNSIIEIKKNEIKELYLKIEEINKEYKSDLYDKENKIERLNNINVSIENDYKLKEKKLNAKIDTLNKNIENSLEDYLKLKKIHDKTIAENKKLQSLLDDKYNEYNDYAKSIWEKKNINLISEIKEVEYRIQQLKIEEKSIEEEINVLKYDKQNLENAINLLEDDSTKFIDNISYIMDRIGKNGVEENKETCLLKKESCKVENINHIRGLIRDEGVDVIEDKTSFIEDLADNFTSIGIGNEYSYKLAKYAFATISNNMGLLLMGYNNRLFADALSFLISNSTADIVIINPGFVDSRQLIDIVNNTESKVVLIENVIDNIAECVYMPLLKENNDKILIFSMESNENINLIPKSIFNYLMVVDLDPILESDKNEELYAGIALDTIFIKNKDNKERRTKILKGLDSSLDIGKFSKLKMIEMCGVINSISSQINEGIFCMLLFSISVISKNQNKYEELYQFIKDQNFERDKLDILKTVIEMDDCYVR